MSAADFAGLAPLAALALGAVAAMLCAPFAKAGRASAFCAGAGLAAAALLAAMRGGAAPAPAGALYADDGLARFGVAFASLSALAALVFFRAAVAAREAPALIALFALGAAALAGARHAATLFLGLEITALSLVPLFAFELSRPALEAAYKFLLMSGLAAAALLLGVALLYAATGGLDFAAWSGHGALSIFGAALLLIGLAFKLSLAPFHMWTPDAFAGAPAAAAALAGAVSKGAVAIALLRLGREAALPEPFWTAALAAFGGASILIGNFLALRQTALPRMLGYSTIAHSGYIAAILASGAPRAGEAVLFYIGAYAPALIAALCAASLIGPSPMLADLRGLAFRRPGAAAALSLGLLSLAGLPAAAGFVGKLYVFAVLIEGRAWGLLAAAAIGSGLGFYYYARFFTAPFFEGAKGGTQAPRPLDAAVLALCAGLMLLFGVFPERLIGLAAATLSLR